MGKMSIQLNSATFVTGYIPKIQIFTSVGHKNEIGMLLIICYYIHVPPDTVCIFILTEQTYFILRECLQGCNLNIKSQITFFSYCCLECHNFCQGESPCRGQACHVCFLCLFLLPWLSWMPGNINLSALDAFFANDKDFLASKA